jgi:hypothetical protein
MATRAELIQLQKERYAEQSKKIQLRNKIYENEQLIKLYIEATQIKIKDFYKKPHTLENLDNIIETYKMNEFDYSVLHQKWVEEMKQKELNNTMNLLDLNFPN